MANMTSTMYCTRFSMSELCKMLRRRSKTAEVETQSEMYLNYNYEKNF